MIVALLPVLFLVPQAGREAPAPASRHLPRARTLVSVEAAAAPVWTEHRSRVAQLGVLYEPGAAELFQWLARNDKWFTVFHAHRKQVRELVASFDVGFTAAAIFTPGRYSRGRLRQYVVGAASSGRRTRSFHDRVGQLVVNTDETARKLKSESFPIIDSPVLLRRYSRGLDGSSDFRRYNSIQAVNRGRIAALHAGYGFRSQDGDVHERDEAGTRSMLATVIGLGERSQSPDRVGPLRPLPPGASPLGRFVFRFHECADAPGYGMSDREKSTCRDLGFWGFTGAQSTLYVHEGVAHERIELHHAAVDNDAFFGIFKERENGIADVATALPKTTLGALNLGVDASKLQKWLTAWLGLVGLTEEAVHGGIRSVLGLDADAKLDGLQSLTLFFTAPASGAAGLEPGLMVRVPGTADQPRKVLSNLTRMMVGDIAGSGVAEPRRLGKGDDAVYYLNLKRLFGPRMGAAESAVIGLFGGGSLTAARSGPWLLLGCSPRTVRGMLRAVRSGETLASRDDFASRFGPKSGRAIEAWFDWPALILRLQPIENLFPLALAGVLDGVPGASTAPLPKVGEIAKHLRVESIRSERADFGHVLHLEGGTMLSPTAWGASVFAIVFTDMICRGLR